MREPKNHIDLEDAILRTLSYFDIFNYPLNMAEIRNFLSVAASETQIQDALEELLRQNQIYHSTGLYALQFHEKIVERRRAGNALADSLTKQIQSKANLIFKFPFVRSVMASGSFSKNFMDENSDFDFFIVCAPQRIWISRMLLVLYKKLFLNNSHKHFCVNYFIDENHLEIDEKNIFTATELATVIPFNGARQYENVIAANQLWLCTFFPNFIARNTAHIESVDQPFAKKLIEAILDVCFGRRLNKLFKKLTLSRWRKTYRHMYSQQDFEIAFKSTDAVSKNHPQHFQKKVIEKYNARVRAFPGKIEAA